MKIAIHNSQFSEFIGGTERLIYYQIKELLKKENVSITLITSKTKNASPFFKSLKLLNSSKLEIIEFNPNFLNIEFTSNDPRRWHLQSVYFGISSQHIYYQRQFDLVITHFSTDSLFIPKKQKNILHLHGTPSNYSEIGEISIRRPDFFIAVSHYVKKTWKNLYPFLKRKKINVVYSGIDTKKFCNKKLYRENDLLFVGRLIKIKGIETLLESLSLIEKKINLIIVGEGPERENLIRRASALGLTNQVKFLGKVSDNELIDLYNKTKITVFRSYAKEGFLLTMQEAASCGAAVITSNACSMPEFIIDKENGLLFEPKNPQDLANKISILLLDEKLRNTLSKKGEFDIRTQSHIEKRVNELYRVYKEIISK